VSTSVLHHYTACLVPNDDFLHISSGQQVSVYGLFTATAWQKPEMEGDLAIRITPYQGDNLPKSQLQTGLTAQYHCHLHQA